MDKQHLQEFIKITRDKHMMIVGVGLLRELKELIELASWPNDELRKSAEAMSQMLSWAIFGAETTYKIEAEQKDFGGKEDL